MRILVADKLEASGLEGLRNRGFDVLYEPELQDEALEARIHESRPEVLIVRGTKVSAKGISDSSLKLIVRAGAGYNTIDVAAASENGTLVSNCPGKNAAAVAELAFGLIISADRRIPDNVAALRAGQWNKKAFSKARGLHGRTIGLVGFGNIGREMVPRAKAFGMTVLVFSEYLDPEDAVAQAIEKVDDLFELARRSDIVSVHTSLRADRKGFLSTKFFEAMQPGAIFVNTSRGEVVDQEALIAAVQGRRITAALDVFEGEPTGAEGAYDGPLRAMDGVYCTHHIGASTEQAQEAVSEETVRIIEVFAATGEAPNAVNANAARAAAVAS